jgi:FKBP-type peptidyl-prolyl cis-trans isomerase SlyD
MNIINNTIATIHFTVCSSDGTQIDSSRNSEPMVFLQGSHFLIQGLEDELEGKTVGDKFVIDINEGMTFRATTDDGEQSVMIIEINEEEVIVDGNHPLSGLTLNFDVEVLEVREATQAEITHGHPHTDDGCGHTH